MAEVLLIETSSDHMRPFGVQFYWLERAMGYSQPNILWGTLALSKPSFQNDRSSLYALDLPRPVYIPHNRFPSVTAEGHYTGRVTLRISDPAFVPVVRSVDQWHDLLVIKNQDNWVSVLGSRRQSTPCTLTLRLENLAYFAAQPAPDPSPPMRVQLAEALSSLTDGLVLYLTALLHSDEVPRGAD
jgi:hypothetical protein